MASDNRTLAKFILDGITPAPRGIPQIEVTFDIDSDGILNVSAVDKATNKEQKIKVEASSGLSSDEIDQMVKDAESKAEEDNEKKELINEKNNLDQLIYATEKTISENSDKVSDDEKKEIEDAIAKGKEAVGSDNLDDIKNASEAISKASHGLAEKMYQQASQDQPTEDSADDNQPDTNEEKKKDEKDVIDAEFTDK